ncbi:hypothetical protein GBA52_016373 [Prunus armeniaca]|nr:hypothetical protein GBA52_016373 [Prunus armeniaca]
MVTMTKKMVVYYIILMQGSACCKPFQSIDANCLAKSLPPFFPPLPQGDCAPGNVAASKAFGSKQ